MSEKLKFRGRFLQGFYFSGQKMNTKCFKNSDEKSS